MFELNEKDTFIRRDGTTVKLTNENLVYIPSFRSNDGISYNVWRDNCYPVCMTYQHPLDIVGVQEDIQKCVILAVEFEDGMEIEIDANYYRDIYYVSIGDVCGKLNRAEFEALKRLVNQV